MNIQDLQALVAASHSHHFKHTSLRERLRDLQQQISELTHHRDAAHLHQEIGDAAWGLLQLCNELNLSVADCVQNTIQRLDKLASGKKVALIGTSANPITNAHLTMGLEILALTDVDEVWYYIAGQHPWGKALMPVNHRLEMVRRATARYPKLKVCDFEAVHADEIYKTTRETAPILRDFFLPAFPTYHFSWVMGSDVAQTFHKWGDAQWLADTLRVIIIHRLGYDFDKEGSILSDPKHVYFRDNIVTSNISSTLVRQRGRGYDHSKLMALVPDIVWDYLVEFRLLDPDALK